MHARGGPKPFSSKPQRGRHAERLRALNRCRARPLIGRRGHPLGRQISRVVPGRCALRQKPKGTRVGVCELRQRAAPRAVLPEEESTSTNLRPMDIVEGSEGSSHLPNALTLYARYAAAQRELLAVLDRASVSGAWPSDDQYAAVRELGKRASCELKAFTRAVKQLRVQSRIRRIQRTSAGERAWQPTPSRFLKLFDNR